LAETGSTGRVHRLTTVLLRSWRASRDHDVVVARWHVLGAPALLPWRIRRRRIVVLVQGVPSDVLSSHGWLRHFPRALRTLSILPLRWADALVAAHEGIAAHVRSLPGVLAPVRVAPNGPPPLPTNLVPVHRDRPYVVFSGVLATWQGVELMLAALDDPRWPEEVDLVVIGDGVESERVRAAADPRVVPLGRLTPDRSQAYVLGALASLCVRTRGPASEHGVSPFKMLEAHALGVPVIVTDIPGQGDHVRANGGGLVIEPTPEDLAEAVARLLDEATHRELASAARAAGLRTRWAQHAQVIADSVTPPVQHQVVR